MRKANGFCNAAVLLVFGATLVGARALSAQADEQEAEQLYNKSCGACHGPQGKGDGPAGKLLKPPAGDFSAVLKGMTDADIAKVIKEGGKAVGKAAAMPAFGSKFSDDQIQELVRYIKQLASK